MKDHKHFWQIMFVTFNVRARNEGFSDSYWYVFHCRDWTCGERKTVDKGKFWGLK